VNYSQSMGGLIATGASSLASGFHAHGVAGSTITPAAGDEPILEWTMTADITVNSPTGVFAPGDPLKLKFVQDGTGGHQVTFDAWWKGVPAVPDMLTGPNTYAIFSFHARSDGHMELDSPWISGASI
jgi:hypothetical protein